MLFIYYESLLYYYLKYIGIIGLIIKIHWEKTSFYKKPLWNFERKNKCKILNVWIMNYSLYVLLMFFCSIKIEAWFLIDNFLQTEKVIFIFLKLETFFDVSWLTFYRLILKENYSTSKIEINHIYHIWIISYTIVILSYKVLFLFRKSRNLKYDFLLIHIKKVKYFINESIIKEIQCTNALYIFVSIINNTCILE